MKYILSIAILLAFVFSSCNNDEPGSATLNVLLVDNPAEYQAVNVEILGVSVNYGSENDENGWTALETDGGITNLLELTAGNEKLLVSNEVPAATISQIRLQLGDQNTIITGEGEYDLITPSGQQSGVKLNLHQTFTEGIDYTVILDFDVSRSILDNPVKYILKPVIRASLEAQNGAIKGIIDPNDAGAVIHAVTMDEDTISSTYINEMGEFLLRGIPEGSYTVGVDLSETSIYDDLIIDNIAVEVGNVTDLETLVLQEK